MRSRISIVYLYAGHRRHRPAALSQHHNGYALHSYLYSAARLPPREGPPRRHLIVPWHRRLLLRLLLLLLRRRCLLPPRHRRAATARLPIGCPRRRVP